MFTTYKPACLALSATVFLLSVPAFALDPAAKPKLGPDAIPVTQDHAYLRTAEAPDYWAMSPFYLPQQTNAACSLASIAVAMNTLRGLPPASDDTLITQDNLLETVANPVWSEQAKQDGDGVKFADLLDAVSKSTQALGIEAEISSVQPASDEAVTLDAFRAVLAANEKSSSDVLIVYFNQGVVTGDWDGPHVSPIGAYDPQTDRVLVMDVDREWYVPYWTPVSVLFEALKKPTSAEHGILEGETGGWVLVARKT
ncbi:MAG: phytochelatin synthase family protein [Phyllobacteriaceae bacterium]|nr:hypothetical protein [Nitratireductor sp.]MCO5133242.1 phytochelatin synthase family protein [Phyllobacteriaceae bacterium]